MVHNLKSCFKFKHTLPRICYSNTISMDDFIYNKKKLNRSRFF